MNSRDLRFVLFEFLKLDRLMKSEKFSQLEINDLDMTLKEAEKIAINILSPANKEGDREGCHLESGSVRVPKSFHRCWRALAENGWISLAENPDFGGQGLPPIIETAVKELFIRANMAFSLYPGLSVGACQLIELNGRDEDRSLFCRNMYSGRWAGTMCLTEPEAGSDLGVIKTKAIPDGTEYKIKGTKCFISGGDHDLTDNIIHLVLARIEGAPEGTKGLSLFIVPKIWVEKNGTLGKQNDVKSVAVEEKMGIKGSATVMLNFGEDDQCRGILLGEKHSGIAKMFHLMNRARMSTALQSLGLSAAAYECALEYAKSRIQSPLITNPKGGSVPIIEHADVRRMLMSMKAQVEGMRVLFLKAQMLLDMSKYAEDPKERKKCGEIAEFMIPLCKAHCSDTAYLVCRDAVQVLGGYGFTKDYPVEQYLRDCKIGSIWEGTNFIQSLDVVGRKLRAEGNHFNSWMEEIEKFILENTGDADFDAETALLKEAAEKIKHEVEKTIQLFGQKETRANVTLFSTRLLDSCAELNIGFLLLSESILARKLMQPLQSNSEERTFYAGKISTAKFYIKNILVNIWGRSKAFDLFDDSALKMSQEGF